VKYFPLVWSGIWRKPARTTLILVQVALAFALFGALQGLKTGLDHAAAHYRADLLFVGPAVFGGAPLPLAHLEKLKSIPGVTAVSFADGILGTYQRPTQAVYVLGLERNTMWLTAFPELFKIEPEDLKALFKTRTGVLISADLGKKYGWHIGDRVPLTSTTLQTNGSGTWLFDIVGTFTDHEPGEASFMVANYAYLDEARTANKGTVRNFYAIISDPKHAAAMSDSIDREFANSAAATQTTSFKELAQQGLKQLGDLRFAMIAIISAVLVALLFSTSTMMMQTLRERAPELAVLKTLGFTDRAVFLILVAEALLVCVSAGLMGLALAMGLFPYVAKFIAGLSMPMTVLAAGVIGAVLVALISVAMPAARAARLQVTDALAGR
jgi:putative ABC transport system permease protein